MIMTQRSISITNMRTKLSFLAGLAVFAAFSIGPAQAEDWQVISDPRLAIEISIPADMNSSGGDAVTHHFTSRTGDRVLLIHLQIGESTFEEAAAQINEVHASQGRWASTGETITPSWAEWHAAAGDYQSVARILPSCGGTEVIAVKVDFSLPTTFDTDRITRSLAAIGDGCL